MCGIIGVVKRGGNVAAEVYEGLERLEYRGYDSAGLSVLDGGVIRTVKKSGRVSNLLPEIEGLKGSVAIGHTRWATHGKATAYNAHPHGCGKFSLVHNGIIENFRELKEELLSAGETFSSDTDSEVIVKLIDRYYTGDFLKAVAAASKRLEGAFAFAVLCEEFDCIVAVRYKSPLILGFAEGGAYVASDIPAMPTGVKKICVPEDGDIAYVTADGARIFNFNLTPVRRPLSDLPVGHYAVGKGDCPHYMLKEIREDGRTLSDTVEKFFCRGDLGMLRKKVAEADCVILTGCGTAYNAALAAKGCFRLQKGAHCFAEIASELRYSLPEITPRTLAVAVTQSGETADTVEALKALRERGAYTVAVTNCGYSAVTRIADAVVPVCAGVEVCVAATKSYIGQLAALSLLGSLPSDAYAQAKELKSLRPALEMVVADCGKAEEIASLCAQSSAVFFLGRGTDCASAVEASLKLKEVSYIFSDAYPAGELKHGTLALVDEKTLGVFLICDERLAVKCANAVEQVVSRGGKAAVITTLPSVAAELKACASVWVLPPCPPSAAPFLSGAALQLVAYYAAVKLGRDPDKPRNLAKSVTVE